MPQQLFELLKRDHRQAERWLSQIEEGPEGKREELFSTLQEALQLHMKMEEKHFYPQLQKVKELKDLVADATEEHEKTKKILVKLENLEVADTKWIPTFQKLQEGLQHHIQDEEKKIFPECMTSIDKKLLQEIGEKCVAEKERAQSSKGGPGKTQTK